MKKILQNYLDQEIGINVERPLRIDAAVLIAVDDAFFSIRDSYKGYIHHFSYNSIIQIIEHPDGIDVGGLFEHKQHFNLVVKIGHIQEYTPL